MKNPRHALYIYTKKGRKKQPAAGGLQKPPAWRNPIRGGRNDEDQHDDRDRFRGFDDGGCRERPDHHGSGAGRCDAVLAGSGWFVHQRTQLQLRFVRRPGAGKLLGQVRRDDQLQLRRGHQEGQDRQQRRDRRLGQAADPKGCRRPGHQGGVRPGDRGDPR